MSAVLILQIALSAAIVLVGASVLALRHQVAGLTPQLPAATGLCQCTHAKSFHKDGTGRCQDLDKRWKIAGTDAIPRCDCQVYVPENQPQPAAAAPPPPPGPGQYDPAYTSWLEWWERTQREKEGTL